MTAAQKIARASVVLQQLRPFYAAVFQVIKKREDKTVSGMIVTENALLYNPTYVDGLSMEAFLYMVLHCVAHIALQHVPRRQGRDPALWNAAADLYVNKLLSDEFWIAAPGRATRISGCNDSIEMPLDALFSSNINIEKDYVEALYASLKAQATHNGYYNEDEEGMFSCGSGAGAAKSQSGQAAPTPVRLRAGTPLDLRESGADPAQAAMRADRVLSDANMRLELAGTSAGLANCRLRVMAEEARHSQVNWRTLLQKHLRSATSRDSSFKRPDKRMLWQKAIYPSPCANDEQKLKELKVCIDISGSVSDTLIEGFYGQVCALTKQFDIEAELIYWDVTVQAKSAFTRFSNLRKQQPYGRGGTDPGCLFRYFDSDSCKAKPLLTLVFTDGYFTPGWDDPRWHRRYKNTIWVLTRQFYHRFQPPFGKRALIRE